MSLHAWLRTSALVLLAFPAYADFRKFEALPVDDELQRQLARIAAETLQEFASNNLTEGNLSITLVELGGSARRASYGGRIPYHPASVVKAFYLVSAHHQASRRRLVLDEPLQKGLRDMIVDSNNDATSYVVDRITGTTSGPELSGSTWRRFVYRRNLPNRFFHPLGYDINANGKTWCEGVYGREKQLLGQNRENRNRITSDAVAALLLWMAQREAVSVPASDAMLALMARGAKDSQVVEFTGEALPPGSRIWSKAGWTSEVRHDAAIVELPNARKYVLAVCTRGTTENTRILPAISAKIVSLFP